VVWSRPDQLIPSGLWQVWLILAGRGFGKTRTGAETVREWVKHNRYVNLIGATANPQAVATTTPKPTKLIRALVKDPTTHVTRGSTYDNQANLAPTFLSKIVTKYEGTRLGRQELNAELLEDNPGALWESCDAG
jgi:phage terminase large subunit-like protein